MTSPEGSFMPVEGLGRGDSSLQATTFKNIISGFDALQRQGQPLDTMQAQASTIFRAISERVPQGYKPIYFLARAFPDFIPVAIPFIQNGATSEEEARDAQKKLDKLVEIDYERKNPVEYHPTSTEQPIFRTTPQVARTIYNAIKYNDEGKNLTIVDWSGLPEMPGSVSLHIEQHGNRWGIAVQVKSEEVDKGERISESQDLSLFVGHSETSDIPTLHTLLQNIILRGRTDASLGTMVFTKYLGGKKAQNASVTEGLAAFSDAVPAVFGEGYATRPYSPTHIVIENDEGDKFDMWMDEMEETYLSDMRVTIDGISVKRRTEDSHMPQLSDDFEQFQKDLQKELQFASGIVDWLYQYSRSELNYYFPVVAPDLGLLDWMEGMIEPIHAAQNSFTDLGGNFDLRLAVEKDADQFVKSFKGETNALKPQNTIFYGETGIGKTSLENAIASKLIEAGIPVFVLQGDLFARALAAKPHEGVTNLKKMFYYLLMHGGAVMVRDFDALIGTRNNPEVNSLVESVLLTELQRLKEDPSTWFIADTQYIGRIPDALTNAHRIGKHREVPIEKDPQGIEHIVTAVLRKIDKELHRRTEPLSFVEIQTNYQFDIPAVAQKIADVGGLIPGQIERIVREEMSDHEAEGYIVQTQGLIDRVDDYVIERARMDAIRREQAQELQTAQLHEALTAAREALAKVTELEEGVVAEVRKLRIDFDDLKQRAERRQEFFQEEMNAVYKRLKRLEDQLSLGPIGLSNDDDTD